MTFLLEAVRTDGSSMVLRLCKTYTKAYKLGQAFLKEPNRHWVRCCYVVRFNEEGLPVGLKEVVK